MKSKLLFVLMFFSVAAGFAQDKNWKELLDPKVYGYVKLDAFYDSRQNVTGREGHFNLWPKDISLDKDGVDKNAAPSFNMLAVQTMLGVKVNGPEILNAKTFAAVEGDFFGQKNDNVNLIRLRHAYFKMTWKTTDLLIGQYWNPVFNLGAFPTTVSFNTGTPILPFSRNPQIRVTQHFGEFAIIGIVQGQRDYSTYGPDPSNPAKSISSSEFLKNSKLPEFHLKLTLDHKHGDCNLKAGIGAGYKRIVPRLITETGYATNQSVPGISSTAYVNYRYKKFNIKFGGTYGSNATDVMSIGGFGVSAILDVERNIYEYTPLASGSLWGDISQGFGAFHVGVFGGYVKHLGADKNLVGPTWGLANNIAYLVRISPRVWYQKKAFRVALELERTVAGYGNPDSVSGIPTDVHEVANNRLLLGVYYFFK